MESTSVSMRLMKKLATLATPKIASLGG